VLSLFLTEEPQMRALRDLPAVAAWRVLLSYIDGHLYYIPAASCPRLARSPPPSARPLTTTPDTARTLNRVFGSPHVL
jgi:hypothetical protein